MNLLEIWVDFDGVIINAGPWDEREMGGPPRNLTQGLISRAEGPAGLAVVWRVDGKVQNIGAWADGVWPKPEGGSWAVEPVMFNATGGLAVREGVTA